jgi:tetratricopeptide (TPR) repeat protein
MTYSYLAGDQAEALEVFEECDRVLRENLGTTPSAQVTVLHEQILQRHLPGVDEKYRPTPVATQPVPYSLGQTPFVGRTRELSALLSLLNRALAKQGAVVLLAGEAGVGKSRLAQELVAHARAAGAMVLLGRCQELSVQLPFQPIVQALRIALPDLPREIFSKIPKFWLSELTKLFPELPTVIEMDLPSSAVLAPEQERLRLFEALTQCFVSLAKQSPLLVMYIDDMQWADATSLDYFNLLVPRLAQVPVFILGTYRSEEVNPGRLLINPTRDIHGRELVHKIEIHRLSFLEVSELLEKLSSSADRRLIERLYAETEGNPFYLISVIQALFEEGVIRLTSNRSWVTEIDDITKNYQELLIPSRVKDVIARRMQALGDKERELLQFAAVAGHAVDYPLLQKKWKDHAELGQTLDKLLERQLLRARAGMGTQFEFSHDKIRQFIYHSLSEPHRQSLHGHVGAGIEELYSGHLHEYFAVLAHHYSLDTAPKKALEYTLKTIERAKQLYQNEDALRLVERGLELIRELETIDAKEAQRWRFELLQRRAEIFFLLGRLPQLEHDLHALEGLSHSLNDRTLMAEAHFQRARLYMTTTRYSLSLSEAQKGYELLRASQENPELLSKHVLNLGAIYFYMNDYGQALRFYEDALQIAHQHADTSREANALNAIALIFARTGNSQRALERNEQALQLYRKMHHRKGECNALTAIGNLHHQLGRPRAALACYEQAYPISLEIGDRREQASVLTNQGNVERKLGLYESALQHYQSAYQIRQELNDRRNQAGLLSNLGTVYQELGQSKTAVGYFQGAHDLWAELNNQAGRALVLLNLGEWQAQQGGYEVALKHFQEASAHYEGFSDAVGYAEALYEMSYVFLEMKSLEQARASVERSLALAEQVESIELQVRNHSLKALVVLAEKQLEEALRFSQRAIELMRDETLVEHPHQIYFNHCRVLEALGKKTEAGEFLEKAVTVVNTRATQLHDENLRLSYLKNVPVNAEILKSWDSQRSLSP